jgi:ribosomal-protein-alanine N-acetyltransferase
MDFEIIATERLLLRILKPEHYKYIFENYAEAEIRSFFGILTDEEFFKAKMKYEGGYTTYRSTILQFQLIDKETQNLIGSSGYHNWFPEHHRAELGYQLTMDEYKNKGLMSETLKTILKYGFNTMDLNRIEAFIGPYNIPSLKLIKKYNFKQEALLRQHYMYNGIIDDSLLFALLKEEYEKEVVTA